MIFAIVPSHTKEDVLNEESVFARKPWWQVFENMRFSSHSYRAILLSAALSATLAATLACQSTHKSASFMPPPQAQAPALVATSSPPDPPQQKPNAAAEPQSKPQVPQALQGCDWDRERFTMDDDYYKQVIASFVQLYKEEKIYRGYRMVNWDPASKSAISDEEVNFRVVNGKLWYLKYPVIGTDEFITVATTRPETMLGDTGVAVNPDDERFKRFIGLKVLLPIVEREIPIFGDEYDRQSV